METDRKHGGNGKGSREDYGGVDMKQIKQFRQQKATDGYSS